MCIRDRDQGLDMIRMDGLIRSNAGTSIGQYVEVKKAAWSEAKHVTLAPVTQGMQIFAPGDVLTRVFNGRPLICLLYTSDAETISSV